MNRCPNCAGILAATMRPMMWCPSCRMRWAGDGTNAEPHRWDALDDLNDIRALLTFAEVLTDLADCGADQTTLLAFATRVVRRAEEVADSYEVLG